MKRWIGAHVGWVSRNCELRNSQNQRCRRCQANRKATLWRAKTSLVRRRHCGVVDPRHAWKLHAREPRDPMAIRSQYGADRWEKAMSHKTHVNGDRESHSGIVPGKRTNEGQGGPKENVEGRPLTKENAEEPNPRRTPSRESGPSGLDRVRQAHPYPEVRFASKYPR